MRRILPLPLPAFSDFFLTTTTRRFSFSSYTHHSLPNRPTATGNTQDAEDMVDGKSHLPTQSQGTDLISQKQQQQKAENAEGAAGKKKKKVTAAQLRVQRGLLDPPSSL